MSDADPALWHCTDPDAFQWRADYDAPFHVYHLKQVVGPCPDGTWLRVDDDVDLSAADPGALDCVLSSYYSPSPFEGRDMPADPLDVAAAYSRAFGIDEGVVAECVFESTDPSEAALVVEHQSARRASEDILRFVSNHNRRYDPRSPDPWRPGRIELAYPPLPDTRSVGLAHVDFSPTDGYLVADVVVTPGDSRCVVECRVADMGWDAYQVREAYQAEVDDETATPEVLQGIDDALCDWVERHIGDKAREQEGSTR